MNRVPVREGGRKSADGLERRVNLLTGLVAFQIVLLVILLVVQLKPDISLPQKSAKKAVAADQIGAGEMDQGDVTATEPVVKQPETGTLPPEVPADRPVRIEILNGCGVPKLAARYADLLRSRGYDVRDTRNADSANYPSTLVFDRTSLPGQSELIGQLLGVPKEHIFERPNPQLVDIDFTLVLGHDYKNLKLHP